MVSALLTKLIPVAFEMRPDHVLEVLGEVANMVVKTWVRIASQVVVQLGDGSLEQIGGLEFSNNLCNLTAALGASCRALTRLG